MSQIQVKKYILIIDNDEVDLLKDANNKRVNTTVDICCDKRTEICYESTTRDSTTTYKKIRLSLSGLHFVRKIYQPGYIQAEVQVTLVNTADIPSVNNMRERFMKKKVSLILNKKTLAENYYIHDVSPLYERNGNTTSIYLRLTIYSMDNLMRIEKYSEAFLGRRLCNDILKVGAHDFILKKPENSTTGDDGSVPVRIDELQHLASKLNSNDTYTSEYIQPYLVQYNETFYDFLARITNRCGEFLYFENGALHVGLIKSHLNNPITIDNYSRLNFQAISEGVLAGGVQYYTHNSRRNSTWTDPSTSSKGRFNVLPWEDEKSNDITKPYPTNRTYNAEVSFDEFYMPLFRDQFSKGAVDELYNDENGGKQVISILSTVLNQTNLLDMVSTVAYDQISAMIQAACTGDKLNDDGNKIIDTYSSMGTDGNKNTGETSAVPFASSNQSTWITIKYYSDIKSNEESQQRQMVCVDMGSEISHLQLGQIVKLPNDTRQYIVVEIDMQSDQNWQRHFDQYAPDGTNTTDGSLMKFYAIPVLTETKGTNEIKHYYPPVLPSGPFRLSEPQHAFVVDTKDPNQQGRIRIRYPWQMDAGEKKKVFQDKAKEYENKKENLSTEKTQLENEKKQKESDLKNLNENKHKLNNDLKALQEELKALNEKDEEYMKKQYKKVLTEDERKNKIEDLKKNKIPQKESEIEDEKSSLQAQIAEIDAMQNEIDQLSYNIFLMKLNEEMADAATPWIRMTSPMATKDGGMFFRPEKGDEVLVNFENGNVERPYVVGTLYSKHVKAPNAGRIIKSPNGHYIKMEDPTDGNKFLSGIIPGIKFLQTYNAFKNYDSVDASKGNFNKHLLGGITMTDAYGFYKIAMSTHDRKISISSPLGDVKIDAFTGITITAPNGNVKIEGKNVEIIANNRLTLTSGKNIKKGLLGTLLSDPNKKAENALTDFAEAGAKMIDKAFGNWVDLSFIRTVLEVFIRPVNGTLEIKSNSFLLLESGGGTAQIPATAHSEHYNKWNKRLTETLRDKYNGFRALEKLIVTVSSASIGEKASKLKTLFENAGAKLAVLKADDGGTDKNIFAIATIVTGKTADQFVADAMNVDTKWKTFATQLNWVGENKKLFESKVKDAFNAVQELKKFCENMYKVFSNDHMKYGPLKELYELIDAQLSNVYADSLIGTLDWVKKIKDIHANTMQHYSDFVDAAFAAKTVTVNQADVKKFKRCLLYYLFNTPAGGSAPINGCKTFSDRHFTITASPQPSPADKKKEAEATALTAGLTTLGVGGLTAVAAATNASKDDIINDTGGAWTSFSNSLNITGDHETENKPLNKFLTTLEDNIRKKLPLFDEASVWSADVKGQILMADGDETVTFTHTEGGTPGLDAIPSANYYNHDKAITYLKNLLIKAGQ